MLRFRYEWHIRKQWDTNYTKINNEIIIYTGGSYWGIATYAFSSNKSLLNIILDNGDVHIYAKSNPPDNVITSSLRKKT